MVHERAARLEAVRQAVRSRIITEWSGSRIWLSAEHLVDRMLGRRPFVGAADRLVGIEFRHRPSQRRPVQRLPQVGSEVEVAEALGIALAAAQERGVVQPLQLVGIALVPAAVGQGLQEQGHQWRRSAGGSKA